MGWYLVELDDAGMSDQLENVDFSRDSFDIGHIDYFFLNKYFDGYFFTSEGMGGEFHFSESSFSDCFTK